MLGELYKYALDNGLSARPGFQKRDIKFYVYFSIKGEYLGIENVEENEEQPYCPDIGSKSQGDMCNIIAEKAEIIFNRHNKKSKKQAFYFDSMNSASEYDKQIGIAVSGLKINLGKIDDDLKAKKCQDKDYVSIKIDGKALENSNDYLEWWDEFRNTLYKKDEEAGEKRCLITGELILPMNIVPSIKGLVGKNSEDQKEGSAKLICFDKEAFQSYGLERAANATVSEQAVTVMNSALEELLKKGNKIAGAKNVHWFSSCTEYDPFELVDLGFGFSDENEETESNGAEFDKLQDDYRVKKLFEFISSKKRPEMPENKYYMMTISRIKSRAMIRSYDEGKYDELCNNVQMWFDDIKLKNKSYPKLWAIYLRFISMSESERVIGISSKDKNDKIIKQLSGLSPRIIYDITHGTLLPDTAAAKALAYIKSDIHASTSDENKKKNVNIDAISCQFLKAWLNRKYRKDNKEEFLIMEKINENSPSLAYNTGRLMAVYAAIQRKALGDVGAGVIERYYTSACSAPALVIGKLATMSQYHLSKLEERDNIFFSRLLQDISGKIGCKFPNTFNLVEQSEFALGYYQQNAELYNKKVKTEE